jgi:GNAT superfamily N-acetyltransferase
MGLETRCKLNTLHLFINRGIDMKTFHIRRMSLQELQNIAIDWAAKEGWNPGLDDAECFYAADPNGFIVGFLNEEPIACISAVAYDENFGFMGFYIVKAEYRGQGYGLKIWNEAIRYMNNRNIGLDGVVDQQENYKKSGFKLAYNNIRYEGSSKIANRPTSSLVFKISTSNIHQIADYDRSLFPAHRVDFLHQWLTQKNGFGYCWIDDNNIKGYGFIRACQKGYKIGPLFADTPEIASQLFDKLCDDLAPHSIIYLDIPEPNTHALTLTQKNDMKPVFNTARMYTKTEPNIKLEKIYGVTSFELG